MRRAFTMFEVLALLLVISMGLLAVIGLSLHAHRNAAKVEGRMTGMATAMTVAYDSRPFFRDPELAAQTGWQAPPALGASPYAFTAEGWINGFYAIRHERSANEDIIASDAGGVAMRAVEVEVEVFESQGGAPVAAFAARLIRQRP